MLEGLVGSCLLKGFDSSKPVAPFHREWWELCCSDHRFVALAAPRGHSKSTSITISYTLGEVLFRSSKFVVIVSDSEAQAIMFLGQIKQYLTENADIIKLCGVKKNEKGADFCEPDRIYGWHSAKHAHPCLSCWGVDRDLGFSSRI